MMMCHTLSHREMGRNIQQLSCDILIYLNREVGMVEGVDGHHPP